MIHPIKKLSLFIALLIGLSSNFTLPMQSRFISASSALGRAALSRSLARGILPNPTMMLGAASTISMPQIQAEQGASSAKQSQAKVQIEPVAIAQTPVAAAQEPAQPVVAKITNDSKAAPKRAQASKKQAQAATSQVQKPNAQAPAPQKRPESVHDTVRRLMQKNKQAKQAAAAGAQAPFIQPIVEPSLGVAAQAVAQLQPDVILVPIQEAQELQIQAQTINNHAEPAVENPVIENKAHGEAIQSDAAKFAQENATPAQANPSIENADMPIAGQPVADFAEGNHGNRNNVNGPKIDAEGAKFNDQPDAGRASQHSGQQGNPQPQIGNVARIGSAAGISDDGGVVEPKVIVEQDPDIIPDPAPEDEPQVHIPGNHHEVIRERVKVQREIELSDEQFAIYQYGNLILNALNARTYLQLLWAGRSEALREMFTDYNELLTRYRTLNEEFFDVLYVDSNERISKVVRDVLSLLIGNNN